MKDNELIINDKKYKLVKVLNIDNKNYIAYEDEESIYVNEYIFEDNQMKLNEISNQEFDKVVKELNL